MEKTSNANSTKDKKKKIATRTIIAIAAIIFFAIVTAINIRSEYLNFIDIGEKYESVFIQKMENKYLVMGISAIIIYIYVYIVNKFIKKGLKKFFDDEKKEMPKLPNKSLSLIFAIVGGVVCSTMLADKLAIFNNQGVFGQVDQIFGQDIGYYIFSLPYFQTALLFLGEVFLATIIYVALYYVITLNTYFDGVDVETLKKNTFIKQEITILVLLVLVVCAYTFVSAQNILTGNMMKIGDEEINLVGAGKTDVTIKFWGYRLLTIVILISVGRLLYYVKKKNFKQSVISALIVPVYFVAMVAIMFGYDVLKIGSNELDNEKIYIGYNIENTKRAYGIDIDQQKNDEYKAITKEQVESNKQVINNIPVITKEVTSKAVEEHQENGLYYSYDNTFLSLYDIDGKDKLVYVTPREISPDVLTSYNNKSLIYTHGYSAVVNSATDNDNDGYAEYILQDFTSQEKMRIKEPRIYFGLQTNSTIMVNNDFGKEYDYPITATKFNENVYDGKAGLKLNFLDRLIMGISQKNVKLFTSTNINENTKIIANRNIIERAKKILPDVLYDEDPYLVIDDNGRLVWVLDGFTRSNSYPYSQPTIINIKGYKEKINYIRNSVKVLIDAYDGTTTFYVTDETDPIIMTYKNMYPDLFSEEPMPQDIVDHLLYPEFLYQIQAEMINLYHDVSEDTLYRADDIWQITNKAAKTNSKMTGVAMEPYYTMVKTFDSPKAELGLVITYNKFGKQNITSYLVGTMNNGKPELSLYKFGSADNVVGITQLNAQIEQDITISKELEALNTSGTKLLKDMIIVPINKTLLYVEPVYQVLLNDKSKAQIPVLKKVIVASGNKVAIGDNLEKALENLFDEANSVDLDIVNTDDIEAIIDSVIKGNNNLKQSLRTQDLEMIGKDMSRLQVLIEQLEVARTKELEQKAKENEKTDIFGNVKNENNVTNTVDNKIDNTNTVNQGSLFDKVLKSEDSNEKKNNVVKENVVSDTVR